MIKFILSTVLSVVGIAMIAMFGSRSLSLGGDIFADMFNFNLGDSQFYWAVFGFIFFSVGELISLLSGRQSGPVVVSVLGRVIQILGFCIAVAALYLGLFHLRKLADPGVGLLPEELSIDLHYNAAVLTAGLCVAVAGQMLVGCGRWFSFRNSESPASTPWPFTVVLSVLLIPILGLLTLAAFFEVAVIQESESTEVVVSIIGYNLLGMATYPFLAFLLFIVFCILDLIRVLVMKRRPSRVGQANILTEPTYSSEK